MINFINFFHRNAFGTTFKLHYYIFFFYLKFYKLLIMLYLYSFSFGVLFIAYGNFILFFLLTPSEDACGSGECLKKIKK